MSIVLKLEELEGELKRIGAPVLDYFLNGLDRDDIISLFRESSIEPTDELIELYQWRNGLGFKDIPVGRLIFGIEGVFYPLQESLKIFNEFGEADWIKYFPVFSDDAFLIQLNKEAKDYGRICIHSPALIINEPQSYFDSLSTMIETCIICFRNGFFSYDTNGFFEQDYDKSLEVARNLNPNSDYWY